MAAHVGIEPGDGNVRLIKFWVAIDVGEVINPDGLKNQVEGAILQAAAWTLKEEVSFDRYEITSTDWQSYPSLGFEDLPGNRNRHP